MEHKINATKLLRKRSANRLLIKRDNYIDNDIDNKTYNEKIIDEIMNNPFSERKVINNEDNADNAEETKCTNNTNNRRVNIFSFIWNMQLSEIIPIAGAIHISIMLRELPPAFIAIFYIIVRYMFD